MQDFGGTKRARAPKETLEVIQPYIKAAGITRLCNLTGLDVLGLPVYTCIRPNSKNLSTSQGKGLTSELAKCSAYMEAIEQYYAENVSEAYRASYKSLANKVSCVDPSILGQSIFNHVDLFSLEMSWTRFKDLRSGEDCFVPKEYISFDLTGAHIENAFFRKTTTGLASGNTLAEARCHALYEIIERNCTHEFSRLKVAEKKQRVIDIESIDYYYAKTLLEKFSAQEIQVVVFDMRNQFELPAYCALIFDQHPLRKLPNFSGYGAHHEKGIALCRALTEAAQSRLTFIAGSRDDIMPNEYQREWKVVDYVGQLNFSEQASQYIDEFEPALEDLTQRFSKAQRLLFYTYTKPDDAIAVVQGLVTGLSV